MYKIGFFFKKTYHLEASENSKPQTSEAKVLKRRKHTDVRPTFLLIFSLKAFVDYLPELSKRSRNHAEN